MTCSCGMGQTPDGLTWFAQALRGGAIPPRDARVKQLWTLLRRRGLLRRSRWLRRLLQRIWRKGLAARQRPRMARRVQLLLQQSGMLSPSSLRPAAASSRTTRPLRAVTVRRLRPVAVRAVRPVRAGAAVRESLR